MTVDELESWSERHIEPGCADENVELVQLPVLAQDALWDNLGRSPKYGLDIGLHESLEVPITGRDSAAAWRPLGDDEFLEIFVAGAHPPLHLLRDEFPEGIVHIGTLLVHAKQGVDLGFYALAEIKVVRRIITEALLVFLCKCVLAITRLIAGASFS